MEDRERLTRRWLFSDYWGVDGYVDSPVEEHLDYGKALLMAANGDGRLTDAEREWVLGYVATGGHSDETLAALRAFDGQGVFEDLFTRGALQFVQKVCIYDAIRACGADGDLADDEVTSVKAMAARLGVDAGTVDDLVALYRDELALKARRMAAVFPAPIPIDA